MSQDYWANDKFERKKLAHDLLAFIDSVANSESLYGESKSLVIGLDAPYGIGKTFFLKGIQQSECLKRPVAYVDAWSDDIIGDPLVSVAATIREAIAPWISEASVREKWDDTAAKAGKIALIASKGLARQALKLAISEVAVDGIEALGENVDRQITDAVRSSAGEAVDEFSDNVAEVSALEKNRYFEQRITELKDVRRAITSIKVSLSSLAKDLRGRGLVTPIIIVVDELDRCRPDYAIKMLEEVKHIFSSSDVCFILGMNSSQLSLSMSAEYGPNFDGAAYLDRFVDRYFTLPFPKVDLFVDEQWVSLLEGASDKMWFPSIKAVPYEGFEMVPSKWLAALVTHYDISPRRIYKFFDRLRTSIALSGQGELLMPYLAELVAIKVSGGLPKEGRPWTFWMPSFMNQGEWIDGDHFFSTCSSILNLDAASRRKALDQERPLNSVLADFVHRQQGVAPQDYSALLERVGNFSIARQE